MAIRDGVATRLSATCCLAAMTACVLALASMPMRAAEAAPPAEPASADAAPPAELSEAAAAPATSAQPPQPPIEKTSPEPFGLGDYFPRWASAQVVGVAVWQFVLAFVFVLAGLVAKKVLDYVLVRYVLAWLRKTMFRFDNLLAEALSKPVSWMALVLAMAAALWVLALPTEPTDVRGLAFGIIKVLLAADVMWFLFRLVDALAAYLTHLSGRTESKLDEQVIPLVRKALKLTVGVVLGVWTVQLLGYSVSSLLAGLGIGGLAVALALQDTLGNFFGSVFIFIDRPFAVGDMVRIDGVEGVVERIGFRSTRIRTWPATLVAIPNRKVAEAIVDNLSQRPKRRVFQVIGVTYETTAEQMEQALASICEMLAADPGVDPEYIVVRFEEFGASSLDIRVLYFTKALDYAGHLETRERVNLAIMRAIKYLGLSIAFPTRTVYFEGPMARGMMRPEDEPSK